MRERRESWCGNNACRPSVLVRLGADSSVGVALVYDT